MSPPGFDSSDFDPSNSWENGDKSNEDTTEPKDDIIEEDDYGKFHADHIMFLIDVREPMLKMNSSNETHILNALRVLLYVLKQRIIARDNSAIGLIFIGACKLSGEKTYIEVLPLQAPSAASIQKLQSLIDNFSPSQFNVSQVPLDSFPLREALWRSSQMFLDKMPSNKALKNSKRVWIFTNDDNPNGSNPQQQDALERIAKDLYESGIEISLWCIDQSKNSPFRVEQFYQRILCCKAKQGEKYSYACATNDPIKEDEDSEDDEDELLVQRVIRATPTGFDVFSNTFKRKYHKKRAAHHGFMDLGLGRMGVVEAGNSEASACSPGRIAVQFFLQLKIAKRPSALKLYSKNNVPVKSKIGYLCKETGESVPENEIKTYVAFGNQSMPLVPMTKQEIFQIRAPLFADTRSVNALSSPLKSSAMPVHNAEHEGVSSTAISGSETSNSTCFSDIEVLYFAPSNLLPHELNLKEPTFIFPHEQGLRGSTVLFSALLQDLHRKGLMAMVRYNGHAPGTMEPRLAALLPQLEVLDAEGLQVQPAGFQMIQLPFRNEVRASPQPVPLAVTLALESNKELCSSAERLISALAIQKPDLTRTLDTNSESEFAIPMFDYQTIPSPALQQFYAVLQAVALSETEYSWSQERDDRMVPDPILHSHAAQPLKEFSEILNLPTNALAISLGKRPTGGTGPNSMAAKKARADAIDVETLQKILSAITDPDTLASIKVDGLKEFCRMLALPVSGKREELIERIARGVEHMMIARGVNRE